MSITAVLTPPPTMRSTPVVGSHVHQCSRYNHQWTCQYSTKCQLEMIVAAQKIIDVMCPACHNLTYGSYAT